MSDRLIVEAIGVDQTADGVFLTLLALNPTGAGSEKQKTTLLIFEAETVAEAAFRAQASTGKPPFFAHARILVIGQSAAEAGIGPLLDFFLHNRTVRNTVPVCVAAPSAQAFLQTDFAAFESAAQATEQAIKTGITAGACVNAPFYSFVNRILSADTEACCPFVWTKSAENGGEHVLSIRETAVFRGDRFAFSLHADDTFTLALLSNEISDALLSVPNKTSGCRFRLLKPKARVRRSKAENVLLISVTVPSVPVEASVVRPTAKNTNEQNVAALQSMLEMRLEQSLRLLYQTQKTDLLRLRRKENIPLRVPPEALEIRFNVEIKTE